MPRKLYEQLPPGLMRAMGAVGGLLPEGLVFGSAYRRQYDLLEASARSSSFVESYVSNQLWRLLTLRGAPCCADHASRDLSLAISTLEALPLVSKDDLKSRAEDFVSGVAANGGSRLTSTSGTSGAPLRLLMDYDASAREWAFMQYRWRAAGMSRRGRRIVLRGQEVLAKQDGQHWRDEPVTRSRIYSAPHLSPATVRAYADSMTSFAPEVLHAYPSTASLLAKLMKLAGVAPPPLKLVLLGSEPLDAAERGELEEFYRCRVLSWYGHTEKCVLAFDSGETGVFAPEWIYGYVELVDEAGNVVRDRGVAGRITGTGFLNSAMSLMRYVTDDWAEWAVPPVAGDLQRARLANIQAHRGREQLIADDGTPIALTVLHGVHDAVLSRVIEMQYVQLAAGEVRLDVIVAEPGHAETIEQLTRLFQRRLEGRLRLTVNAVSQIPKGANGKRLLVRTE